MQNVFVQQRKKCIILSSQFTTALTGIHHIKNQIFHSKPLKTGQPAPGVAADWAWMPGTKKKGGCVNPQPPFYRYFGAPGRI
ncbi:hypothetical protein ACGLWX_12180 [Halomonas sp. HMF6819]|uniref:hypothetical protein n=1 Tax=Halomonas sp. HMF6819 TaxID=3373085 RepID=UPI0037B36EF0